MSYIVELNEDSQETIGEKSSLIAALQEFKKSYEEKIKAFDSYGSDNCILQAKINFQQEWINDLTEQNEMLVHTVEELEQEATERVLSLEKKLKQSSQCASEVMNGYNNMSLNLDSTFKEMDKLQSDVKNLVTLITRIREDPDLNFEDLEFFTISKKELTNGSNKMRKSRITFQDDGFQMEEKEAKIRELESKLENAQSCSIIKDKYNSLKQSMLDMRDALTAEVADKHDTILSLRRDVQILEEQCRKADQQTHFKDDIIKELRKENKQFKQELLEREQSDLTENIVEICTLKAENEKLRDEIVKLEEEKKKSEESSIRLIEYEEIIEELEIKLEKKESFILKLQEEKMQFRLVNIEKTNLKHPEKVAFNNSETPNLEITRCTEIVPSNDEIVINRIDVQEVDTDLKFREHKTATNILTTQMLPENIQVIDLIENPGRERSIRFDDETAKESYTLEYVKEVSLDFENSSRDISSICDTTTTKSILKNDSKSLKDVVTNLQESVTQLMTKETDSFKIRERIKELEQQVQKNSEKDELIEVQNETLNIIETELQAWRLKETEVELARNCREEEINNLKEIIDILTKNLENEKSRSENLQKAIEESNEICTKLWSFTLQADEDIRNLFSEKKAFIDLINTLRDENLTLEVKLFYSYQDIEVYEIRLLKYQTSCKSLESQNLELKQRMHALINQKEEQDTFINDISEQLFQCKHELKNLFAVLNEEQTVLEDESATMNNQIMVLQAELFTLTQKLEISVHCLQNEKESNNYLQVEHAKKEFEINCLKNELIRVNDKLKEAATEVLSLKEKALLLEYRLQTYEESVINLDRESSICQKNVQHCIENMNIVKENYQMKVEECEKLKKQHEEDYKELRIIKEDLKNLEISSNKYEFKVKNLKDKVSAKECECKKMCEELSGTKNKLAESISNELYLQQNNETLQTDFNAKIDNLESEKRHLVRVIEGNDKRITFLNSELNRKEALLEEANNNLATFYSTHETHMQNYEDGVLELKNEINNLLQAKDTLHAENDNLERQVEKLHMIINENKEKEAITSNELQQCLVHLEAIEKEKQILAKQNEDLIREIESLQGTCDMRAASVENLEAELYDTRNIRDNLRHESQNVIHNVKSWLDEQRKINVELTKKLAQKNILIASLNEEKILLQNKIKKLTDYLKGNSGLYSSRVPNAVGMGPNYSLDSMESHDYTSGDSDWDSNSTPKVILHRVESITEDVQRTSYYWKNQFGDNEYIVSRDK